MYMTQYSTTSMFFNISFTCYCIITHVYMLLYYYTCVHVTVLLHMCTCYYIITYVYMLLYYYTCVHVTVLLYMCTCYCIITYVYMLLYCWIYCR